MENDYCQLYNTITIQFFVELPFRKERECFPVVNYLVLLYFLAPYTFLLLRLQRDPMLLNSYP